ncbi:MAG: CaiB/BaiF CoA transferase family protein [Lautropia sp.]
MSGPLQGLSVVEFAGLGPAPFCGMLLADMGARVVRIERPAATPPVRGILERGREFVALDLKRPEHVESAMARIADADVLIEGFRPGVMERLGLGPRECHARNPRLVYGRVTGWGLDGPLSDAPGHDINYVALTGALNAIGTADSGPVPPLNLLGDFGGGGMLLGFGVVCAVLEARRSGRGQVVDAAMIDGVSLMMASTYAAKAAGRLRDERASNMLDGGAHFYGVYRCADGLWISIGSIEPQFYSCLIEKLGLDPEEFAGQMDRHRWPVLKRRLQQIFASRSRAEWCALLEGSDACFAPVLDMDEAPLHAHNRQRGTFVQVEGTWQPAPAPRFDRTPARRPGT